MKHILSAWVEDKPGVLSKVSGLFSRRGYNLESVVVSRTQDETIAQMTIVVSGDDKIIEQVKKQLNKLIEVIKVSDITNIQTVNRQLLLIRVATNKTNRSEIIKLMDIFRARIVDVGKKSLMIEATGEEEKIEAIIEALKPFGVQDFIRTGTVSMVRENREK